MVAFVHGPAYTYFVELDYAWWIDSLYVPRRFFDQQGRSLSLLTLGWAPSNISRYWWGAVKTIGVEGSWSGGMGATLVRAVVL